ncbi:MAG: hypothetical protein GXP48_02680 [Acidobacteria bacterium]|nr:hypothetical protein [Acidobacteriota bacterium]
MLVDLKPYPAYKNSGVEWLGEVPTHWEVRRAKTLFTKVERPVRPMDEVVTCFRDGVVTLRRNRRTQGFTESLKEIGYQGIRRGDLVIHAMDAFAGAVGVADSDGKGTPVYAVCVPRPGANAYFFALVVREMARNEWILALSKGIRERSTDFRYGTFASQWLPVPPLPEQAVIVSFLEGHTTRIDRGVDATRREISLLNELRTRLIADVVRGNLDVREVAARLTEEDEEPETMDEVENGWAAEDRPGALDPLPEGESA